MKLDAISASPSLSVQERGSKVLGGQTTHSLFDELVCFQTGTTHLHFQLSSANTDSVTMIRPLGASRWEIAVAPALPVPVEPVDY